MDHFLLIVIFFIFSISTNAQIDDDSSITNTSWFWPLLGISLTLLISIPSALITLVFYCYNKHKSNHNSDESSIRSNSTISERQPRHSRHIEGFRSPPPPYTTCDRPSNVFMTSSHPPSYEAHINEDLPAIVNVPPSPSTAVLDRSLTLLSPSLQTFQA